MLKNCNLFTIIFVILLFLPKVISAQQKQILIRKIVPFESTKNAKLEKYIKSKLKKSIQKYKLQFNTSKNEPPFLYADIYYKTYEDFPPDLYAQIYNPENNDIIDAVSDTTDFELINDIELDLNEFQNEERVDDFVKKIEVSLDVNRNREKLNYNIIENFFNKPISKNKDIVIAKIDTQKEAKKVFEVLEENKVVTASRKAQTVQESPAKVIVIDGQTIERRGYRTLTELLQDVPGFDFQSFHDSGEFTTDLMLRGIGDVGQTQILIMEDGIVQNDIGNGWMRHVQFDITLIDVKRVEIILGPGSALYGANAYAGLINIITKKGNDIHGENKKNNLNWKGDISYGSYKTKMFESLMSYRLENGLSFWLAGRYYQTPGDGGLRRPDPGNYFHNNYEPEKVTINDYGKVNGSYPNVNNDKLPGNANIPLKDGFNTSKKNIFLRGGIQKEGFTFGYTLWDLEEGLASYVPGYEYFANTDGIPYQKKHNGYYIHADYAFEITKKFNSIVKLYTRNTTIHPDTGFVYTYRFQSVESPVINGVLYPPTPNKAKQYHEQSYLSGIQEQFNYKLTNTNDLVFGLQLDRVQRAASGDELGGISLGHKQSTKSTIIERRWNTQDETQAVAATFYSTNAALYIQDEQKFWNDKYSLTIGIRRDYDTDYGYVWTSRSGLVGHPISWMYFKLLYGEAFKAPTVFQLYDEFRGNEFLKPQKIKTYETEITFVPYKFLNIKAGYFFSQLLGLIAEAPNPNNGTYVVGTESQKATYYQNLSPTHIYGTSLEVELKLGKNVSAYTNYTFTGDRDRKTLFEVESDSITGKIKNITPVYDGHEIDNIAARKLNVGMYYKFLDNFYSDIRLNWVSRRKAPTTNRYFQPYDYGFTKYPYVTEGTPDGYMSGYTLVNLTLGYDNMFGVARLSSKLIIRNLANKAYSGMGRQSGSATRPIDALQPSIQNPDGFVSPYHPQMGRTVYFQLSYQL
ncbi:MAG: TonB-dependent receptor plug domain-containing protein [Leptospiraceae bacterium]|nr:TonB-dependent receptor plug domain-containing protein [Leptospiraceae bacterium]